jgi:hypothetical protein
MNISIMDIIHDNEEKQHGWLRKVDDLTLLLLIFILKLPNTIFT